ncbi:MAG: hypothetical protein WCK51_06535 [Armatimonadota bacterium]
MNFALLTAVAAARPAFPTYTPKFVAGATRECVITDAKPNLSLCGYTWMRMVNSFLTQPIYVSSGYTEKFDNDRSPDQRPGLFPLRLLDSTAPCGFTAAVGEDPQNPSGYITWAWTCFRGLQKYATKRPEPRAQAKEFTRQTLTAAEQTFFNREVPQTTNLKFTPTEVSVRPITSTLLTGSIVYQRVKDPNDDTPSFEPPPSVSFVRSGTTYRRLASCIKGKEKFSKIEPAWVSPAGWLVCIAESNGFTGYLWLFPPGTTSDRTSVINRDGRTGRSKGPQGFIISP